MAIHIHILTKDKRTKDQLPTPQQVQKIKQAIRQWEELLNKELKYSPDLQKKDKIEEYRKAIAKLNRMLETGEGLPKNPFA